jgi:hypothetical protein
MGRTLSFDTGIIGASIELPSTEFDRFPEQRSEENALSGE